MKSFINYNEGIFHDMNSVELIFLWLVKWKRKPVNVKPGHSLCSYTSILKMINPLINFGSNHVDFGGITSPISEIAKS